MKVRSLTFAFVFSLALAASALAQDSNPAPNAPPPAGPQNNNGGYGQRGGRGYGMGMGGGMGMGMADGRGVLGTVTEVAADHYIVKADTGEIYTVHFSANTRMMKQPAGGRGPGGTGRRGGQESDQAAGGGAGRGGTPPEPIKPTDIKVGDAVGAMGQMDAGTKSLGAIVIVQLDPERAKQMEKRAEEMRTNYGKTWIQGKVTAIDGVKVTLQGMMDNAPHSFVADENTVFRKRREPVTLADIQVGDMVRADGTLKDGAFLAATVNIMVMRQGEGAPPPPAGFQPQ